MSNNTSRHASTHLHTKASAKKQILTGLGAGVILLVVFLAGWGVGNGRLTFDSVKTLNSSAPSQLDYSELNQVYSTLKDRFDGKLDQQALIDGMAKGMAEATGDQHTQFFNAADAKEFNLQLNGTIVGIGAQLGVSDEGYIEVISPIDGSPASKAGISSKDIIAEVDGESTTGWSTDKAVSKIRGDKGTKVTLTIVRGEETKKYEIIRDEITVPSVESEILEGNIGYMKINQFSEDTTSLATKAAEKFKQAKVTGVVLDLRGNPGGTVESSVAVASLWLPKNKTILEEKRGGSKVIKSYYASGKNTLLGIPTRVLIDGGSASASEIVAGALKDNNAATLIGTKSYGKGSVQELRNFANGSLLKVTIARWHRPNGDNIDKKGITPDINIEFSEEDIALKRDVQKNKALEELRK